MKRKWVGPLLTVAMLALALWALERGRWRGSRALVFASLLLAVAALAPVWTVTRMAAPAAVAQADDAVAYSPEALDALRAQDRAVFVTLREEGQLRGCIGSLVPEEALYQSVHNNAVNAALRDPRFSPLRDEERTNLSVSVSILGPIRDVADASAFRPGQHGIILRKGPARAVFLPEVAVEQGWTREETLSYLSRKAGLAEDAWRRGARFQVFESVVLSRTGR
mgnify:CR=1 FL=1